MKKLMIMLAMVFIFTACTATDGETVPDSAPTPEPEFMAAGNIEDILNAEKIKIFQSLDVQIDFVEKTANGKKYIRFNKNDRELLLEYDVTNPIAVNYWGSNLVVIKPDGLEYYYLNDLSYVDTVTVTEFEGKIIDAIPHGHGFMAVYYEGDEYGLAKFRASGGYMYRLPLNLGDDNPVMQVYGVPKARTYLTYLDKDMYVTDKSQKQLMFVSEIGLDNSGSYNSFVYNLANNSWYYPEIIVNQNIDGEKLMIIRAKKDRYGTDLNNNIPAKAVRLKDGNPVGYVEFNAEYLKNGNFGFAGVEVAVADKNTVEFYSNHLQQKLTVNFASKKASLKKA